MAQCPSAAPSGLTILLGHGGGGRLMHELLNDLLPCFQVGEDPQANLDAAVCAMPSSRIAFTTDSYVVRPRRFPGGDIGMLAVHGTLNDLAMVGAQPRYLSCSLIIEEGFERAELAALIASMSDAARACGVTVVTGDTKVVERGCGDGLFINTAGVGVLSPGVDIGPHRVEPGDCILLSGDIGRHAVAVMTARDNLQFEEPVLTDSMSLAPSVQALLQANVDVRFMRDITRGGLASALVETAIASQRSLAVDESAVCVSPGVAAACELTGLDPWHLACEGRFIAVVPEADMDRAIATLRAVDHRNDPRSIGLVESGREGKVRCRSVYGSTRSLVMASGELLPRIC